MSGGNKPGAYLGSVRCVKTLHERCVMGDGGCWHLRSASGRPYSKNGETAMRLWVFGLGSLTATRAAWTVAHDMTLPEAVVYRVCDSHDCVNPAHLGMGSRKAVGKHRQKSGKAKANIRHASLAALRRVSRKLRKLTDEQAREIRHRPESAAKLAPVYGISASAIIDIRAGNRYRDVAAGASVFALGSAAC